MLRKRDVGRGGLDVIERFDFVDELGPPLLRLNRRFDDVAQEILAAFAGHRGREEPLYDGVEC